MNLGKTLFGNNLITKKFKKIVDNYNYLWYNGQRKWEKEIL